MSRRTAGGRRRGCCTSWHARLALQHWSATSWRQRAWTERSGRALRFVRMRAARQRATASLRAQPAGASLRLSQPAACRRSTGLTTINLERIDRILRRRCVGNRASLPPVVRAASCSADRIPRHTALLSQPRRARSYTTFECRAWCQCATTRPQRCAPRRAPARAPGRAPRRAESRTEPRAARRIAAHRRAQSCRTRHPAVLGTARSDFKHMRGPMPTWLGCVQRVARDARKKARKRHGASHRRLIQLCNACDETARSAARTPTNECAQTTIWSRTDG